MHRLVHEHPSHESTFLTTPLLLQNPDTMNSITGLQSQKSDAQSNVPTAANEQSMATRIKTRMSYLHKTLTPAELSGSLGDLGTFIPLTTALARQRKISLAPSLFWAGICNIISGLKWDVPMCVQPMKSIAAVALSGDVENGGLDALSVTTAGILTGAAVLFLGVSNLMEVVNAIVPETVVVGIQVGVGMRLASRGMNDVMGLSWTGGYDCILLAIGCALMSLYWLRENEMTNENGADNANETQTHRASNDLQFSTDCSSDENVELGQYNREMRQEALHPESSHSATVASSDQTSSHSELESSMHDNTPHQKQMESSKMQQIWNRTCCCLHLSPSTPHPVGIYLFLIGSIFAAITLATAGPDSEYDLPLHFFGAPIAINSLKGVSLSDWRIGFFRGALPQLPLTTLNSVISVCCLAHQLYPEKRCTDKDNTSDAVISRREVSISVGLMNLLLCPLGSMPNCHGAGGLAGQHRFGARHGTSVVILGMFKVLLAVFFGGSALTLLDALPVAVLGVMVTIAGLELIGTGVSMLVGSVERIKEKSALEPKTILREKTLVAMVTASVIISTARTDYGALSGWVAHMIYGHGFLDFVDWIKRKRNARM